VPQTEKLKSDVMNSVVIVIQEDHPPVSRVATSAVAFAPLLHLGSGGGGGGGGGVGKGGLGGEVGQPSQANAGLRVLSLGCIWVL
jgi:hypothetical protein